MAGYTFKYLAWKSFCPSRFEKLHPRFPIQDTLRQSCAVCKNISSENRIAVCTTHSALLPAIIKASLYFFNDKASRCVNLVLCDTTSCQRSEGNGKTYINITVSQVVHFSLNSLSGRWGSLLFHLVGGFWILRKLWIHTFCGIYAENFPQMTILWPKKKFFLCNQGSVFHRASSLHYPLNLSLAERKEVSHRPDTDWLCDSRTVTSNSGPSLVN